MPIKRKSPDDKQADDIAQWISNKDIVARDPKIIKNAVSFGITWNQIIEEQGYLRALSDMMGLPGKADDAGPVSDISAQEIRREAEDDEFVDSLNPEEGAIEGEIILALIRHRRREHRLRVQKLQQTRNATGQLRCEVPGCGFDFFEAYGEIGEGFAHVHHLQPLGGRTEPSRTDLTDLAIVCANCHAMIHRGGEVRPLEGLIRRE